MQPTGSIVGVCPKIGDNPIHGHFNWKNEFVKGGWNSFDIFRQNQVGPPDATKRVSFVPRRFQTTPCAGATFFAPEIGDPQTNSRRQKIKKHIPSGKLFKFAMENGPARFDDLQYYIFQKMCSIAMFNFQMVIRPVPNYHPPFPVAKNYVFYN